MQEDHNEAPDACLLDISALDALSAELPPNAFGEAIRHVLCELRTGPIGYLGHDRHV